MKAFILALIVCLAINGSQAQFWRACPSGPGASAVTSSNCDGTSCTVTRGQSLIATATFTPSATHSTLTSRYVAVIANVEQELQSGDNACLDVTGGCPVSGGAPHTWNINVEVESFLPQLNNVPVRGRKILGFLKVYIINDSNLSTVQLLDGATVVVCVEVTASIL